MRCFGQHHREGGHALAMPAGVGATFSSIARLMRLTNDLEQPLQLGDKQAVGERNGRLGPAIRPGSGRLARRNDGARLRVARALMSCSTPISSGRGSSSAPSGRTASGNPFAHQRPACQKSRSPSAVRIGNVHRAVVNGRMGGYQRIIGRAIGRAQGQQRQIHRFARGAAQANAVNPCAESRTSAPTGPGHAVQRAAIGTGDGFGRPEYFPASAQCHRSRDRAAPMPIELFRPTEQIESGFLLMRPPRIQRW